MNAIERAKRLVEQGNGLIGAGKLAAARAKFEEALRLLPGHPGVLNNLGVVLEKLGRLEEALDKYETVRRLTPPHPGLLNNCGVVLRKLGRAPEALQRFDQALALKPDYAEALANRGNVLVEQLDRPEDALASFDRALQVRPNHADSWSGRGIALARLGRPVESAASYGKALALRPGFAEAHAQKLHQLAMACDWEAGTPGEDTLATLGISGEAVSPFALLSLDDDPARQRARAERFIEEKHPGPTARSAARAGVRPERLRIGYFSADFQTHPVMHLIARLFEVHDRDRFEVHAYSFGPDSKDAMRARVTAAVGSFRDVRSLRDSDVAALARKDGIDIAVDLLGFTGGCRPDIFAHRAAPVQINYLGYPGTMGAPFIDYIVADRILIPEEQRRHYAEKIIYLPGSYQVNDDTRAISDRAVTRSEEGLPEQGIVFCCFNNNYKITPAEFDVWMRLLRQVGGSVLWLLKANPWAEQNLRREAEKRGVDPARLVFAERTPLPEHLARHRLADLFLDTFAYNAHTTASDALWAGLPIVTKMGRGFPARVAASLLHAVDLPELVTDATEDYERLALELATHPEKLAALGQKLLRARQTASLFDTERYARQLEDAYREVAAR